MRTPRDVGGGYLSAESVSVVHAHARAGVDARWTVIEGDPEFFEGERAQLPQKSSCLHSYTDVRWVCI